MDGMRKTINIDGVIYEECSHAEWTADKNAILLEVMKASTYYRLKPREPRTWEGKLWEAAGQINTESGELWNWPGNIKVKITEVIE